MTAFSNDLRSYRFLAIIIMLVILTSFAITIMQMYNLIYVKPPTASSTQYENLVKKLVFEVLREVEKIRGLSIGENINIMLINTSWAIETWAPKEEGEVPKELLYKEMLYKLTFLLPYDRTIVQKEREWVGMFAAAVAGTTLYINTDYFNPNDPTARNILAHELTHVAQYLHFNIESPRTIDGSLAVLTLVEGDAGWTQHLYCITTKLCEPSPPTRIYLDDLYLSLNLFPYIYGENFVRYLYEHGGWELVNKAYGKPPKSTLMILKPEIYLDYLINGVDIIVNVSVNIYEDGEPLYSDVLGPYYLMLVTAKYIGLSKAEDLAINWRGDKVVLYSSLSGNKSSWFIVWNISWSSPSYTLNFYNNFTSILKRKGDIVEVGSRKVIAFISASNRVKHVVEVEVAGDLNVVIKARFIEEN